MREKILRVIAKHKSASAETIAKELVAKKSSMCASLFGLYKAGVLGREKRRVTLGGKKCSIYFYEILRAPKKKELLKEKILKALKDGEQTSKEIAEKMKKPKATVVYCLKGLAMQRAVFERKEGKRSFFSLSGGTVKLPASMARRLDAVVMDAHRKSRGLPVVEKDSDGLIDESLFCFKDKKSVRRIVMTDEGYRTVLAA